MGKPWDILFTYFVYNKSHWRGFKSYCLDMFRAQVVDMKTAMETLGNSERTFSIYLLKI